MVVMCSCNMVQAAPAVVGHASVVVTCYATAVRPDHCVHDGLCVHQSAGGNGCALAGEGSVSWQYLQGPTHPCICGTPEEFRATSQLQLQPPNYIGVSGVYLTILKSVEKRPEEATWRQITRGKC